MNSGPDRAFHLDRMSVGQKHRKLKSILAATDFFHIRQIICFRKCLSLLVYYKLIFLMKYLVVLINYGIK